ncbi:MAG: hypothetical protein K6T83_01625 [Alicyclobacillus sp.]|nr:hypothetical protein [Alicyclobacillus sp.]
MKDFIPNNDVEQVEYGVWANQMKDREACGNDRVSTFQCRFLRRMKRKYRGKAGGFPGCMGYGMENKRVRTGTRAVGSKWKIGTNRPSATVRYESCDLNKSLYAKSFQIPKP